MASMNRLRAEHDELLPHLQELLLAADRVGDAPFDSLKEIVDEVHEFLAVHLIPHALAEDEVLYPAVERVTGAPGSTATMSRDHVEVARLTDELGRYRAHLAQVTPGHIQEKVLRRVLYGLHALVRLHFAKEEEILVPLLERGLTEDEADQMFFAMTQSAEAHRAKALQKAHPGSRMLSA